MEIRLDDSPSVSKVAFNGDIDLLGIKELKDYLFELSSKTAKDIELDLSSATYLDSSGIGMLLTLNKMQKAKGKALRMINIPDKIARVLELSSLDMVL